MAVDHLSFSVTLGTVFALLGPNGAGKTTTVEILEGYRRADGGEVRVLGLDPAARGTALRSRIGVMLQEGGLYPTITAREALKLFARFYPSPRQPDELLELVGLTDVAGTRYRRLSGGEKQRLALALALLPNPELVFLDEPTAGMDPQARRTTWEIIMGLRSARVTVVLTTHYLEEAERLADQVAIVHAGKLVALGTPAELTQGDSSVVRIRLDQPVEPALLQALPSAVQAQGGNDGKYEIQSDDVPSLLVELAICLRTHGVGVQEIRAGRSSLEETFLRLTGKEYTE